MKNIVIVLLLCALLTGCTPGGKPAETTLPVVETVETVPSTTETLDTIIVFSPNEDLDGYIQTEVQGHQLTILEALVEVGVLPAEVQVNEIAWDSEARTIHVDFNAAFQDLIHTQGSTGELMIMGSVVNTFLTANDAETMTITVEGEILESGHVIYDFPMEFYQ